MENQKLEIVAQNLLTYCIMPNCDTHGISLKELLEYMIRMNYREIDTSLENNNSIDELKIKKKRGRPKGSKNKAVA